MAEIPQADRYLNLAGIEMGEALAEMNNIRQRGEPAGLSYTTVQLKLMKACAYLQGQVYVAPVDPEHVENKPGS